MTADERLALISIKTDRAKKHLEDLKDEIALFLQTAPYKIGIKSDPSQNVTTYLESAEVIPNSISTITGDTIHNLRSALDHLAYQLFLVAGSNVNKEDVSFSCANPAKDKSFNKKVEFMRQDAKDMLLRIEAYKGGKGERLWQLGKLNNIDKHRLLVTVRHQVRSVNILPAMAPLLDLPKELLGAFEGLWIRPADTTLKDGEPLFVGSPNSEAAEVKFEIGLSEPGVIESKPLLETLQGFLDAVSQTVLDFKPCLE